HGLVQISFSFGSDLCFASLGCGLGFCSVLSGLEISLGGLEFGVCFTDLGGQLCCGGFGLNSCLLAGSSSVLGSLGLRSFSFGLCSGMLFGRGGSLFLQFR